MKIEQIQKIWTIIGTLIAMLSVPWIPGWLNDLFGVAGTDIVFQAIGAVIALYQFVAARTGENKPAKLSISGSEASIVYILNPFKAA